VPAEGLCGHPDTYVDFKNDDRAPLLLIGGGKDHLVAGLDKPRRLMLDG
jgi:hypothetical protein